MDLFRRIHDQVLVEVYRKNGALMARPVEYELADLSVLKGNYEPHNSTARHLLAELEREEKQVAQKIRGPEGR